MKQIACSTCKHNKKPECELWAMNAYVDCLNKPGNTKLPNLPKKMKNLYYFKWTPIWDCLPDELIWDCLPDELFEI